MTKEITEKKAREFFLSADTVELIRRDIARESSEGFFDKSLVEMSKNVPVAAIVILPDDQAMVGVELEGSGQTHESAPYGHSQESSVNAEITIQKFDDCYWCIKIGDYERCIKKPFCW